MVNYINYSWLSNYKYNILSIFQDKISCTAANGPVFDPG